MALVRFFTRMCNSAFVSVEHMDWLDCPGLLFIIFLFKSFGVLARQICMVEDAHLASERIETIYVGGCEACSAGTQISS